LQIPVHQFNPDMAPDSEFVRGALKHLVVGNRGRWMDPRRTPFHIVSIVPHTGQVVIEIDDFEDRGTRIEIPFERVMSYQMAIGSAEASAAETEQLSRRRSMPRWPEVASRLARFSAMGCSSVRSFRLNGSS